LQRRFDGEADDWTEAVRTLAFLMGLRYRQVAVALAAHGFTQADIDEGFQRLAALTNGRLDVVPIPATADPAQVRALDLWENRWFPIVNATLRVRFAELHAIIFNNLTQTEGIEVIVSMSTMLSRLDAASKDQKNKAAFALLSQRGLTDTIIADAKRLLKAVATVETTIEEKPSITPEQDARLETELWDWYLEWSGIARAAISDRRALRALGFLSDRGTAVDDDEDGDDGEQGPPVAPVAPVVVRAAPTPKKPRIEPGMPGSSPFIDEEEDPSAR